MHKYIHLALGWFCVALGVIGAVLPLLPTTVFLILAAYFFTKGSPRLRHWLMDHHVFGPAIHDWEATGSIAPRYKAIAVGMMVATLTASFIFGLASHILIIQAVCMVCAGTYVLTRPNS